MKNNRTTEGPDITSIIENITNRSREEKNETMSSIDKDIPEITDTPDAEYQGRLWKEFMENLNDPEENATERTKLYAIDDDIVETLHQCSFGKPNVHIINSILRTFLVDNITRLRDMHRPRTISLLDKY